MDSSYCPWLFLNQGGDLVERQPPAALHIEACLEITVVIDLERIAAYFDVDAHTYERRVERSEFPVPDRNHAAGANQAWLAPVPCEFLGRRVEVCLGTEELQPLFPEGFGILNVDPPAGELVCQAGVLPFLTNRQGHLIGRYDYSRHLVGFSQCHTCLLYTSPSPRDGLLSRMPSSA